MGVRIEDRRKGSAPTLSIPPNPRSQLVRLPFPLGFSLCQHFTSHWWHFSKMLASPGSLPSTPWPELRALFFVHLQHISCICTIALRPLSLFSSCGYFRLSLIGRNCVSSHHHQCQVCDKYSFGVSWMGITESHLVQLQPEHLQTDYHFTSTALLLSKFKAWSRVPTTSTCFIRLKTQYSLVLSHSY